MSAGVPRGMGTGGEAYDAHKFEAGLRRFVGERFPDLLEHIRSTGDLPKEERLQEAIGAFKESFQAAD